MAETPEQRARAEFARLLAAAGWSMQSMHEANIRAARGKALGEFPLNIGSGFANYLLYANADAACSIEAQKEGAMLTGFEVHSGNFSEELPNSLPA